MFEALVPVGPSPPAPLPTLGEGGLPSSPCQAPLAQSLGEGPGVRARFVPAIYDPASFSFPPGDFGVRWLDTAFSLTRAAPGASRREKRCPATALQRAPGNRGHGYEGTKP